MEKKILLAMGASLRIAHEVEAAKGVMVICPGGGYAWLSGREDEPIARAFAEMGWTTAVLSYTCFDEEKSEPLGTLPLRQLGEAVGWVRSAYPGKKVAVCGFSAGGHLAASLGVHHHDMNLPAPDALVLCYPVITAGEFRHPGSMFHLAGHSDASYYSLEHFVDAHTPPAFIWHTAEDQTVPVENSLMMAAAFAKAKVPFELHIYPHGNHGLSLATEEVAEPGREPDAHVGGWVDLCAQWLDIQMSK